VPAHELPARPVLALAPGVGDVDIVLASELLEAGRTIASGFVTPDRTLMIASTARSYLVVEKMAMGDGRYDSARLTKAIETHAQSHILFDMEALAKQSGAVVNAVMLGSIAGCARLPIPAEAFERAIRADGKAVDANLRGFRAGLDAAAKAHVPRVDDKTHRRPDALAELERGIVAPPAARDVVSPARADSPRIRTSPMRSFISIAWRRSAPRTRARKRAAGSCARPHGTSPCGCPTRM